MKVFLQMVFYKKIVLYYPLVKKRLDQHFDHGIAGMDM